ncbi:MAG: haloacid dehalogenase type II [Chitinophagaceae bacterium]
MQANKKPSVILFDVNETLMNMSPLKKKVNDILHSKRGFRIWFGMLLQYSLVDNCTGQYHDFSAIADATLDMAAQALQREIEEDEKKEALALMKKLSAYTDVEEGLKLLKQAGFRLATLTNSPMQTLSAQLDPTGLTKYFEATLSIDAVQKYKPAPETYQYAAQTLGVSTGDVIMVAAHGWDITGALQAGMQAAFIERKGQSLYPLASKPHFVCEDLVEFANAVIKL